jgi:hypothetical protein
MEPRGGSDPSSRSGNPAMPSGLLLASALVAAAALGILAYVLTSRGLPAQTTLVTLEICLLAYTLLILAWLSTLSIRSFSQDASAISSQFTSETNRLLEENRAHWADQSGALRSAVGSLDKAVGLQASTLETMRQATDFNRALLELERERERIRVEATEVRRQRMQPLVGYILRVPSGGVQLKHMNLTVYNRGSEARDLAVFFGVPQVNVLEGHVIALAYHVSHVFDFGDIAGWPEAATLEVTIEASDVDHNRYRFSGTLEYTRNKNGMVSFPRIEPEDWQFPEPVRAN